MVSALPSLVPFCRPFDSSLSLFAALLLCFFVMAQFVGSGAAAAAADRPLAFVYRGPKDDPDLSQAVGELLESSPREFTVQYVGPDDITSSNLETVKVFAFPGGPDVNDTWKELKPVAPLIRDYVSSGGRYLGFCLGAYLAGPSPGLALLPAGADVAAECDEDGAQVRDEEDTVIQVDWSFSSGDDKGRVVKDRWVYYQEGNYVSDFTENATSFVLARYSKTGHVAATLNQYGKGWVGTTGPHPEATQHWFDSYDLDAPDGLQFDIGHDLIEATMSGGKNVKSLKEADVVANSKNADTKESAGSKRSNPFRRLFRT